MTDANTPSSFRFQWGNINLEVEGDDALVQQGFELVKDELLDRIGEAPSSDEVAEAMTGGDERDTEVDDQLPTPAEYTEGKQPSNNMERAAVLAHYAQKYRNQDTITADQLERLINEAHIPMFSASDALYNASRSDRGWTERVATGTYELTPAGENYVQTQLPPDDG